MGSSSVVGNTSVVCYCCVWKGGRVLYAYNNNNSNSRGDIENLAALCLELAPPHHRWYFETMDHNTYAFLMDDDGYVYFAIVYHSFVNARVLRFLQKLRDEFRRLVVVGKRASTTSLVNNHSLSLQEQLSPLVRQLAASLAENDVLTNSPYNTNNRNGQMINELGGSSTKSPLLGKHNKHDKKNKNIKKKMKNEEHLVIGVREIEIIQEHRRSSASSSTTDNSNNRGVRPDDSNADTSSTRIRSTSSTQNLLLKKKWCRQVKIILAVDVAVCLVLFVIWLVICDGIKCIH
ncbi:hypothetical protein ABFX02_03G128000 [Erythranthe guttata]